MDNAKEENTVFMTRRKIICVHCNTGQLERDCQPAFGLESFPCKPAEAIYNRTSQIEVT
jgi:hypothetical protein